MENLNLLAIVVAAVVTFVIGGLWYSPALFHRAWMRANKLTEADVAGGNTGLIFGVAFVFALIMSFNLAMFLGEPDNHRLRVLKDQAIAFQVEQVG